MALHNELGKEGEELAAQWLASRGYRILHRNWRFAHLEIDIIASRGKFLHFVEVKTRYENPYSHPEDNVTRKKFRRLKQAADEYLFRHPGNPWIQYDIVSVTLRRNGDPEFFLLADVFI